MDLKTQWNPGLGLAVGEVDKHFTQAVMYEVEMYSSRDVIHPMYVSG